MNWTELRTGILDSANTTLHLPGKNFFSNYDQEIVIGSMKSISIIGNGAVLDAHREGRLFSVTSGGSLVLVNLTLQHAILPSSSTIRGPALSVVGHCCSIYALGVHFFGNEATGDGSCAGAVYIYEVPVAGVGLSSRFSSCIFEGNRAGKDGGGMYMHVNDAAPSFASCIWLSNSVSDGGYGGGLYLRGNIESEMPLDKPQSTLLDCTFQLNSAGHYGGGAYILHVSSSFASCIWLSNSVGAGGYGGGLYLRAVSKTKGQQSVLLSCSFQLNCAGHSGGGAYILDASPSFDRCIWLSNSVLDGDGAHGDGGGLYLQGDSETEGVPQSALKNCTFQLNSAGYEGGGSLIKDASPSIVSCIWLGNSVADHGYGGGLFLRGGSNTDGVPQPTLVHCTFEANHAGHGGGGVYLQVASPSFAICIWLNNSVDDAGHGGGMDLSGERALLQSALSNCTFEANYAGSGGGMYVYDASPSFASCIWCRNTASTAGGLRLYSPSRNITTLPSVLQSCTFTWNHAGQGGAVDATSIPGLTFISVIFLQNEATSGSGGAIHFAAFADPLRAMVNFFNCKFEANIAQANNGNGGGLFLLIYPMATADTKSPAMIILVGTAFVGNSAGAKGGAVSAAFPQDTPTNLRFLDENCSGVSCTQPDTPSRNTPPALFATHTARTWARTVILRLTDISFRRNSAGESGGALAITNGAVTLTNASMTESSAGLYGGAFYLDGTASLSASNTVWAKNKVSLDGQHVYAESGAGSWNFSGSTDFEHSDTNVLGVSAVKIDGALGLDDARQVVVTCPAGAVPTENGQWVSNFTAVSGEWSLNGGETTITTTGAYYPTTGSVCPNGEPRPVNKFCKLNPTITTKSNTNCQAQYFSNYMCGNPPAVYPPMLYTIASLGCKQCSRSEAALPAGNQAGFHSKCEACPDQWTQSGAAKCENGLVVQQPGWWWAGNGSGLITNETQFWACYTNRQACLGSPYGISIRSDQCAVGHTGPVCAVCKSGYAMAHSVCKKCSGDAWTVIGVAAALVVVVIASTAGLYYHREKLGIAKKMSAIKIIVGFYSLLAVLEQTFAVTWPVGFQHMVSQVKAAFASLLDLSSLSCAIPVNWFQKIGFWCLALPVVLCAIAIAFSRALFKARKGANQCRKVKIKTLVDAVFGADRPPGFDVKYSGRAFYVLLLIYPFLSPAVVAVFRCREVADGWYLVADYSLRCFDSQWTWWAVPSAAVCVFYVAGLPVLALLSVIRKSPSIEFISAGYRTDGGRIILGWEVSFELFCLIVCLFITRFCFIFLQVLEMVRKFLLTSAVIFWPKGSCIQLAVAVVLCQCSFWCCTCTTCHLSPQLTTGVKQ
jgi:predicted outer membrane repeat protein